MQERVIVGIDVGTTKICVLAGELDRDGKMNIVGVGTCPSQGLRRGVVVNIEETVTSIAAALDRAERLSGKKITTAYVGIAGSHIASENSKGFVAISPSHRDIVQNDISRAIEVARAIAIPAKSRGDPCDTTRLCCRRARGYKEPDWHVWLPPGSGGAYHYRCGIFYSQLN